MDLKSELKLLDNNYKGKLFLTAFRRSNYFTKNKFLRVIGKPYRLYYKIIFNYVLGIDIQDTTKIGKGFNVYHGQGLIINSSVIIGDNVTIRQNTTIGSAKKNGGCPIIGNNVEIGANSVIIGDIRIGDNVIIAAGSVVVKDIQPNVIIAGNPAVIIKRR